MIEAHPSFDVDPPSRPSMGLECSELRNVRVGFPFEVMETVQELHFDRTSCT